MTNKLRDVKFLKLTWKGNDHISKSGAQDFILQNLANDQFPILSFTKKHGRLWTAATETQLKVMVKKNHGIYEIFPEEGKRKVYFDIDKTEVSLEEIKALIFEKFPGANLQISGRNILLIPEAETRLPEQQSSWHITISNYYAMNLLAMAPVRELCKKWKEFGFDPCVYTKNRNYKCINQSKPEKPVQEYLEGHLELSKHLVMHDFDENAINIATLDFGFKEIEQIQKKVKESAVVDILSIPQFEFPSPENFDWLTASPLDKLAILPCPSRNRPDCFTHNLCWQIMLWCLTVGITFEEFWKWNQQKETSVSRYKKYKAAWDAPRDYCVKAGLINILLLRFYPKIKESNVTKKLREQFNIKETTTIEGINGKYLSSDNISTKKKWTYLISSMGSGKTGSVVSFLEKHGKGKRVIWLTPRITLTQDTWQRLGNNGLGFESYKNISKKDKNNGKLDEYTNIICSIQSLHYLKSEFDIIIIDEIETLLQTFEGNAATHQRKLNDNWEVFKILCHKASKIILMDAFATRMTTNLVKGIIRQYDSHIGDNLEVVQVKGHPTQRWFQE